MGGSPSQQSYSPPPPSPQQIAMQNQTSIMGQDTNRQTWQNQYDQHFSDLYSNQQKLDAQNAQAKQARASGGSFNVDPTLQQNINTNQSWINSNPWKGFNWGGIDYSDHSAQGQIDSITKKWSDYMNPTQQAINSQNTATNLANQQAGAQAAAVSATGLNPQTAKAQAVSPSTVSGGPSAQLYALSDQNKKKGSQQNLI